MPVIWFVIGASAWKCAHLAGAFNKGLSETGYVEGRNERVVASLNRPGGNFTGATTLSVVVGAKVLFRRGRTARATA